MKKDECISKFVASLIIAFPFMAMFAFLVELFTVEVFIEISKNHGSLVAGILGVLGTIALVVIQIKLNRENISKSRDLVYEERFEIERSAVLSSIDSINHHLTKTAGAVMSPRLQGDVFLRRFIADTDTILENLPVIVNFCQKNAHLNQDGKGVYKVISFMLFYTYMVNSLLSFLLNNDEISEGLIGDMESRIFSRLLDADIYFDDKLKDQTLANIRAIASEDSVITIMDRWGNLNHKILKKTKDWIVFTNY